MNPKESGIEGVKGDNLKNYIILNFANSTFQMVDRNKYVIHTKNQDLGSIVGDVKFLKLRTIRHRCELLDSLLYKA